MPLKYPRKTEALSKVLESVSFILFLIMNIRKRSSDASFKKIVLIEPFQLGDIISLTVMLEPLKKKYPSSEIFIMTKKSNSFVLENDTRVKATISLDFPWSSHKEKKLKLSKLISLIRQVWKLRRENFDLGIDCRGDVRSQIILKIAGCRNILGYTSYLHSNINSFGLLLNKKVKSGPYKHRYEWNRFLLTGLNISENELFPLTFPSFQHTISATNLFREDEKLFKLLIHPGSGWEYRQWSFSNWIRVIEKIYNPEEVDIVVIGGPGENEILTRLKSSLNKDDIKFAITDFIQLQNVILESDLFLCLDSGPMNLAVSLNKSVLALFGPGDVEKWKPYNNNSKFIHRGDKLPCSPCLQKTCVFPNNNCMSLIPVNEVVNELEDFLKSKKTAVPVDISFSKNDLISNF